jgi:cell division protein ZapE
LDATTDYRLGRTQGFKIFHFPLNDDTRIEMDRTFLDLADGDPIGLGAIEVNDRMLVIPKATKNVARFHFGELCDQALGAGDYLALSHRFPVIMIDNIPTLSADKRDAAKRFVTLIDALYEAKTLLVCSAESPPQDLYPEGIGAFEFQRTVSRLMEMQSESYIHQSRTQLEP